MQLGLEPGTKLTSEYLEGCRQGGEAGLPRRGWNNMWGIRTKMESAIDFDHHTASTHV